MAALGLLIAPQGPAYASACGLAGSGTAGSPWEVGSRADFRLVAKDNCLASGHYRQTADLIGDQMLSSYSDAVFPNFTGVYDGDHYRIELGGSGAGGWAESAMQNEPLGLFHTIVNGVVKKVRLTGVIHSHHPTSNLVAGTLARVVQGGLISEVDSDVRFIRSAGSRNFNFGGLVGLASTTTLRIEYSSFTGSVEWTPDVVATASVNSAVGGLVYRVSSSDFNLRDSYASFSGTIVRPAGTPATANLDIGGLLGVADTSGAVRIVRSYSSPRLTVTGPAVNDGGLVGWQFNSGVQRQFVSVFWQADQASNAVGRGTTGPAVYSAGLPVAVPLAESRLQALTSYQTREGSAGEPGGAQLTVAASTGTLAEQDYRWAIEQSNVSVFIPSQYMTESNYLTRQLFTDTSVARTYQTRGTNLEGTATGYPALGRVWEVCPEVNRGFPVLVWQEHDCPSLGGSGSTTAPTTAPTPATTTAPAPATTTAPATTPATTPSASPAALLATTGASSFEISWGFLVSAVLILSGLLAIAARRRLRISSQRDT